MSIPRERPITNAEVSLLIHRLKERGAWGLARAELAAWFGGDRRGRRVVEVARRRGLAPIVVAVNPQGREVYRLAQSEEEVRMFVSRLRSRIKALEEAASGIEQAWEQGLREPEQPLFPQEARHEEDPS